jgi:RNA-directed DNA polymerase
MQALYLLALDPVAETTADPNSYGFRPQRSTADAIEQCFTALGNLQSAQWILEGAIQSGFDGISHEWLLAHIPMEKAMLKKWLKSGYIEENTLYPTEEGTPQGGILSPVLANLTLDGLERRLRERFPKTTVKGIAAKVNFIRYADDFIITAASQALLEQEVKPLVEAFMQERGLTLSSEKTRITHIEEGFDFLGQNVRKDKTGKQHKLLLKPARKNVHAHLEKIRAIIKKHQTLSAGRLILLLNPIIRGWAQYHQHVVSADVFRDVDDAIYRRLRQWMKRRHPKKANRWITKKYFQTSGGNNWVFSGEKDGQVYHLAETASVPIKRHAKVKAHANPYDPAWETYSEKRLDVHIADTVKGKQGLIRLWKEQNGRCLLCQQTITKITGWHSHHLEWRSKGGPDRAENRVLLHPNCHQQLHSQGLHVEKPRPSKGGSSA